MSASPRRQRRWAIACCVSVDGWVQKRGGKGGERLICSREWNERERERGGGGGGRERERQRKNDRKSPFIKI